jgi:stage IV sporulation protein A
LTASALERELESKYDVPVVACNVEEMEEEELLGVLQKILFEFPLTEISVEIPRWLQSLPVENKRVEKLLAELKELAPSLAKMKDCFRLQSLFSDSEEYLSPNGLSMDLGKGRVGIFVGTTEKLFFDAVSDECGEGISGDYELLKYVRELADSKRNYDRIKSAFESAEQSGYGMVEPIEEELSLEEPKLIKKSAGYGVKFKAGAPCYHVLKVDVTGEINPIVGTKQQGEEFVAEAVEAYESGTDKVWQTNIFGKTLKELVMDELMGKTNAMPMEVRKKMRRTVTRIVNEGKGGVICILL